MKDGEDPAWTQIDNLISANKEATDVETTNTALGTKVKDMYIGAIDKNLREIDLTMKPEEIYELLLTWLPKGGV